MLVLGWPLHSRWSSFHINRLKKLKVSFQWLSGTRPTTPMKFENAALSLRFGVPSTLIHHENGSFSKTLLKPEPFKLKRRLRVLMRVEGEIFENDNVAKITLFPWPSSSITTPNWPLIVTLLISPTYNVDAKKHLLHFRTENTVSKFLRSVYEASGWQWYSCQMTHNFFLCSYHWRILQKMGEGCIGVDRETKLALRHGSLLGKTPHQV